MKVKLTHDTSVRYPMGTVLDLPEEEAKRLISLNNAEVMTEEKPKKTATKKK